MSKKKENQPFFPKEILDKYINKSNKPKNYKFGWEIEEDVKRFEIMCGVRKQEDS